MGWIRGRSRVGLKVETKGMIRVRWLSKLGKKGKVL